MTTVTDSDIKEIKEMISTGLKELNTKIDQKFETVQKDINELKVAMAEVKVGLESLEKRSNDLGSYMDKRIGNQEFITRAVVIGIITSLVGSFFRFLWIFPFS